MEVRTEGHTYTEGHMKCRTITRILALAVAILLLPSAVPPSPAGSLTTSVLGMFPKDVGEFVYVDLKTARRFSWFAQFKDQVVPSRFRQFEKFLAAAGIDPDTHVDELAWAAVMSGTKTVQAKAEAPVPPPAKDSPDKASTPPAKKPAPVRAPLPEISGEQIVGIAIGNFSPDSAEKYFEKQKLPTLKLRGFTLYGFGAGTGPGDIFFFFIDSNTAAFGHRQELEKLIDVRFGAEESFLRNEHIYPLVDEVNGHGVMWAAMDDGYTRLGINQLLPEAAQFPDAGKLLARVKAMTIDVQADNGIDTHLSAVCGSPDDANAFAQLLQAGLLFRRYQEAKTNPDLAKAIDSSTVSASGDRLKVGLALNNELLMALLRRNTFALRN